MTRKMQRMTRTRLKSRATPRGLTRKLTKSWLLMMSDVKVRFFGNFFRMFASQCISLNIIVSAPRVFEARAVHALAIFMCDKFQHIGWLLCKTQKLVRTMSQLDLCARTCVCARVRACMRVCACVCTRRVCMCVCMCVCVHCSLCVW